MLVGDIDEPLVDAIYGIATREGDWNPALDRVRSLLNSCEVSLTVFDPRNALLSQQTASGLLTDDIRNEYRRYYGALDPKMRILARRGPGYLFNDAEHFDESFVRRDPFYQEFSRSIGTRHTLDMLMLRSSDKHIYLAAMRSSKRGPYDREAARAFCRASRHFLRGIELNEKLDFAACAAGALDRLSAGIIVIGAHGRIDLANGRAKSILDAAGALRSSRGKLFACSAGTDHKLQAAILQALAGVLQPSALRIAQADHGAWTVWVMPLPSTNKLLQSAAPAALVVIGDSAGVRIEIPELISIYGLTKAEAELASALGSGETLGEVAARRGVKFSTVRTQLLSVLGKMGLRRQADLTRTLASTARPLNLTDSRS